MSGAWVLIAVLAGFSEVPAMHRFHSQSVCIEAIQLLNKTHHVLVVSCLHDPEPSK